MYNMHEIKLHGYTAIIGFFREEQGWALGSMPGLRSFEPGELKLYIDFLKLVQEKLDERRLFGSPTNMEIKNA